MGTVLDALRALGARVDGDRLPFTLHGTGGAARRRGGDRRVGVLAVRLRAAAVRRPLRQGRHRASTTASRCRRCRTSTMTVRHAAHRRRGGRRRGRRTRWRVAPGPIAARDWTVEPDLSNAAVFLAAAAVTGGEVTVAGWPARSTQPGAAILPVLEPVPARTVAAGGRRDDRAGPADACAGVDVDLHDAGELTPTVAAVAALATGPSRIRGVAHIRGPRDRPAGRARHRAHRARRRRRARPPTAWRSGPRRCARARTGRGGAYADHRMATAGALVGLVVPGVAVDDIGVHRQDDPRLPGRLGGAARVEPGDDRSAPRVRRVRRPGAARAAAARGRAASAARSTPTPSRRWSPRSTAAAGPARPDGDSRPRPPVTAMRARELGRTPDRRRRPGRAGRRPVRQPRTRSPGSSGSRSGRTVLRRTADDNDPFERIVVANAEQLVIVTAVADPEPRTGFVDRCLVAAYAGGLAPVLCLTKADLADPEPFAAQLPRAGPAGARDPRATGGPTALASVLAGRVSALVGHSGVGKSTLVNALVPDADRAVGRVVGGRQGPAHHRRRRSPCRCPRSAAAAGWSTPRACARSGWPTSPRTTCSPRSTTWPTAIEDCPRGCGHLGPPADPECALDTLVAAGPAARRPARRAPPRPRRPAPGLKPLGTGSRGTPPGC